MSNEREQVESVFGLTGGELDDKATRYAFRHPSGEVRRGWFRFWYEGWPSYASSRQRDGSDAFTAVTCVLFSELPRRIFRRGRLWRRVAVYRSSGEAQCPEASWEDAPARGEACPLCEAGPGEPHGYVYLGDGWVEAVYRARP